MFTYTTKGTCSKQIIFDVDAEDRVHNVKFIGGCSGNLQGIGRLVEGRTTTELIPLLRGIRCRNNIIKKHKKKKPQLPKHPRARPGGPRVSVFSFLPNARPSRPFFPFQAHNARAP